MVVTWPKAKVKTGPKWEFLLIGYPEAGKFHWGFGGDLVEKEGYKPSFFHSLPLKTHKGLGLKPTPGFFSPVFGGQKRALKGFSKKFSRVFPGPTLANCSWERGPPFFAGNNPFFRGGF